MSEREAMAVVVGSSFSEGFAAATGLVEERVTTPLGAVIVHRLPSGDRPAWCLFRHGLPHRQLPQQIRWRAHTAALREIGVTSLLVTSSVGVLDAALPLFEPLLISDLLMLENRLPDGSLCTMFDRPAASQGHLVLDEGLFSLELSAQVRRLAEAAGAPVRGEVVFGYSPGPRTKTRAENAAWAKLGAQVNSMTLGPEVVLANELGIACAGLVVGHKYSLPLQRKGLDDDSVPASLVRARENLERLVLAFLRGGAPVPFRNSLFRFGR